MFKLVKQRRSENEWHLPYTHISTQWRIKCAVFKTIQAENEHQMNEGSGNDWMKKFPVLGNGKIGQISQPFSNTKVLTECRARCSFKWLGVECLI